MSSERSNDYLEAGGGRPQDEPVSDATAAVRFRIHGTLRFLSHAETMRLWQRACVRAALCLKYTRGFNPHPKMSLPLPRTVGVASDDELLVLRLFCERGLPGRADAAGRQMWETRTRETLNRTVPHGVDVVSVELMRSGVSFRCGAAVYEFPVRTGAPEVVDRVKQAIQKVLTSERLMVERRSPKNPGARHIDVRPFLQAVDWQGDGLKVTCNVTASGTVRVQEMMEVLELETGTLAGPIRRTAVQWHIA